MRLLLVEDGALVAEAIAVLLRGDAEVIHVADGEQARVRIAAGEEFDVVLSDVVMPNMDGLRLLLWVRAARPEFARRFLFMTSEPELPAAHILSAKYVVLRKPFTRDELLKAIHATLGAGRFAARTARSTPSGQLANGVRSGRTRRP